jgi:hypothetical protein
MPLSGTIFGGVALGSKSLQWRWLCNTLHDGQQAAALLRSLGLGISAWLE